MTINDMPDPLMFVPLRGNDALPFVDDIAALRIAVFSEYPYLYDGNMAYERAYLAAYLKSPHSFIGLAYDGEHIVGATTAIWLPDAEPPFRAPFDERAWIIDEVCYYGESVLLPAFRGRGAGKKFMELRETFAKSIPRVTTAAFCAVVRDEAHPQRPASYRPLDSFWRSCGFQPVNGMLAHFPWKDHGEAYPSLKSLQFWIKSLR